MAQQQLQSHNGSERRLSNSKKYENSHDGKSSYIENFPKGVDWGQCTALDVSSSNITTGEEYANFEFQPEWMKSKEYWDHDFEQRHLSQLADAKRPPLKIIIVPHSHNDPGWLKTFVGYFQADSRQILNNVITHMHKLYTDMTFIWTEISFLQMWWDQAHPIKQRVSKIVTKF